MAILTRQPQKVFAGNADADQLAVFGTMKTGTPVYSTDLATLQSTAYTEGWDEAILDDKAPYLEEMNAVQYGLSYQTAYILQEGIPEYDANTNYSAKSVVKAIESNKVVLYHSLSDDNLGHALSNTTYWEPYLANVANTDLSNLTTTGNNKFANRALSNLSNGLSNTICTTQPSTSSTATSAKPAVIIKNYLNGASGYVIFSDGFCIQWGQISNSGAGITVSLLRTYKNTNYSVQMQMFRANTSSTGYSYAWGINSVSTGSFKFSGYTAYEKWFWRTCGYLASSQY